MDNDADKPIWSRWKNVIAAIAALGALLGVIAMAAQTLVDVGGINQAGPNTDNSETNAECSVVTKDVSENSSVNINVGGNVCE